MEKEIQEKTSFTEDSEKQKIVFKKNNSKNNLFEKELNESIQEISMEEIEKEKLKETEEEQKLKSKQLIEAALFLSPSIVSLTDLSRTSNKPIQLIKVLINELNHELEERNSALEIIGEGNGFRLAVKKELEDLVSHYASSPEIHKGILKTLALIAFKQPVKQSEIINLRNSKAYEHIKILKEKGFIKKEKQGITYIITTTHKFIEYFGESIKQHEMQGKNTENALELLNKMKKEKDSE